MSSVISSKVSFPELGFKSMAGAGTIRVDSACPDTRLRENQ
jgi:hypothetical protein